MQDQAPGFFGTRFYENRNHHGVLAVWPRDHGSLQTDPGTSGLLPRMLPEPKSHGRRRRLEFLFLPRLRNRQAEVPAPPLQANDLPEVGQALPPAHRLFLTFSANVPPTQFTVSPPESKVSRTVCASCMGVKGLWRKATPCWTPSFKIASWV